MKKIRFTFQQQAIGGIVLIIISGILSFVFRKGIFHNIAWIVYGLAFIINPVWPQSWKHVDPAKMKKGCYIAGGICIFIGLITRFGMSI